MMKRHLKVFVLASACLAAVTAAAQDRFTLFAKKPRSALPRKSFVVTYLH